MMNMLKTMFAAVGALCSAAFAATPFYETMREAADDWRLVKTLQRRGCGTLVDELHKTTSTLRQAADFDAIHERLMAELMK